MIRIYLLIFFSIPAVAAAVGLRIAWSEGILRRPILFLLWFALALLLQFAGRVYSPGWAIGLTLQAALAVYLGIRIKLET